MLNHHDESVPSSAPFFRRRAWILQCLAASGALATTGHANALAVSLSTLSQDPEPKKESDAPPFTKEMIRNAGWLSRVPLTDDQCEAIAASLNAKNASVRSLRSMPIDDNTPTAMTFTPWFFANRISENPPTSVASTPKTLALPESIPEFATIDECAFWSVRQLAAGLRAKKFTSVQLTQMYLDRLRKYDPLLKCVVTYNDQAIDQAHRADIELANGNDKGILHGIPWGAKDIIAIPGMPTTWGAVDYQNTVRDGTATIAQRMIDAGAVLLAKLSVGTLAWGDQWFRAMTRNPWDPDKGSSGSSAGSASAAVAGLVGFAIGSETLGSIVSPTRICCTTGLRPTFGRVSRHGCMTLGWSMDKIGPIARFVDDCAAIFPFMIGSDGLDATVVERPFAMPDEAWNVKSLRVGLPSNARASEKRIAELLEANGATIVPLDLPPDPRILAMTDAITVEAATMHGDLFERITEDSQVGKWAPTFREAQFCSAIDYVRALRARVDLIQKTEAALNEVDLLIGDGDLARMNLTGHPSLVVSFGENAERKRPNTVVLTARLFAESVLLATGAWIQKQLPAKPAKPTLDLESAKAN
jgi:Asp-tRNA(Asn)/Glu-tRNA(Gln) amidotransferase A subunit family amidase